MYTSTKYRKQFCFLRKGQTPAYETRFQIPLWRFHRINNEPEKQTVTVGRKNVGLQTCLGVCLVHELVDSLPFLFLISALNKKK
jgi:hypothetical protein